MTPFILGLYSNLTMLCFNRRKMTNAISQCTTGSYLQKIGCHQCSGTMCDNVISNIESRTECEFYEVNCYALIRTTGVVVRGCGLSEECHRSPERCRLCNSYFCNSELSGENPLMCPRSRHLKNFDPLDSVIFEKCPMRTTTGIVDQCAVIMNANEMPNGEVKHDCYMNSHGVCQNESVWCETAHSPADLPEEFKCIQCKSDVIDEESCSETGLGIRPTACQVFATPVRGCYQRYNPFLGVIQRGCASDLDHFTYKRCIHPYFYDCSVCNRQGCNKEKITLELGNV